MTELHVKGPAQEIPFIHNKFGVRIGRVSASRELRFQFRYSVIESAELGQHLVQEGIDIDLVVTLLEANGANTLGGNVLRSQWHVFMFSSPGATVAIAARRRA
jgi:hypothetical protein